MSSGRLRDIVDLSPVILAIRNGAEILGAGRSRPAVKPAEEHACGHQHHVQAERAVVFIR